MVHQHCGKSGVKSSVTRTVEERGGEGREGGREEHKQEKMSLLLPLAAVTVV